MHKILIAYLFTLTIAAVITVPTILTLTDNKCEVSSLFDKGEEEDKQGKESVKDQEIKVYQSYSNVFLFLNPYNLNTQKEYSNTYNPVYKIIFSPPPEQNIS